MSGILFGPFKHLWIDILEDNTISCRIDYLFFMSEYENMYNQLKEEYLKSAEFICLKTLFGGCVTLHTYGKKEPIIFCEWSPVNGSMMKRRFFISRTIIPVETIMPLPQMGDVYRTCKFPLIHFMRLYDAE